MLTISPHHRAIQQYYDELRGYDAQGATHESATSTAFQNLLATLGREVGWTLIPQLPLDNGRRPEAPWRTTTGILMATGRPTTPATISRPRSATRCG